MIISNVRRVIQQEPGVYRLGLISSSSLYMDFTGGFGVSLGVPSSAASLLTTTRASDGYSDDIAGNWTLFGPGVPRITNKGLLVEESRTNSIRNNSMQGAVAGVIGSGGAYSTNWANNTSGAITGLTFTVGLTTIFGVDVLSLQVAGTPGATGQVRIAFDTTTQIVANTGETWALSAFLALLAGSYTNIGQIRLAHQERNAGGTSLRGTVSSDIKASIGATLSRLAFAATMGASTARNQPELMIDVTSGQAIDLTIAIGWPQLELGAFATSPIRTTSAAATRAADLIVGPALTVGSALTLFAEMTAGGSATTQAVAQVDEGVAANRVFLWRNNTTPNGNVREAGVDSASLPNGTLAAGSSGKLVIAAASNDAAFCFNGGTVQTDATVTFPTGMNRLVLGQNGAGAVSLNGYLRRVAYFPTRLTNAQLQSLTS